MAPSLLSARDIGDDISNTANTFSSWDSCMSEAYCKWPAIVGIIIGSLIVISIIWCCARCLCGVECCCGCCSCFNRCCPSPRRKNDGYQQAPPPQPYQQYHGPSQPMMYGGGGYAYQGAQTASFDAPSKNGKYNEDALPAMPSWDQAQRRHVQDEDVEMEKLDQNSAQQESLLNKRRDSGGRYYNNDVPQAAAGDLGTMQTGPYHDYNSHQQFAGSPTSSAPGSMYPPSYQRQQQPPRQFTDLSGTTYYPPPSDPRYREGGSPPGMPAAPASDVHGEQHYAPSIPPSYHTAAPSIVSPVQQQSMPYGGVGRKPVQGSWRDV